MKKIQLLSAVNASIAGNIGADLLAAAILEKPDCLLGLATGSTPVPLYHALIAKHQAGQLDFNQVRSVNLDEYVGLKGDHPQSYRYFMNEVLFSKINIRQENTKVPDGIAADQNACCEAYESQIKAWGGIDYQLLGIGQNGHIGFNEPAAVFSRRTQVVALTASTREANKRFFDRLEDVPTHAITMGIGTIMTARKILLVCTGEQKAEILEKSLFGEIDPQVPASVLQLHRRLTVVADEAALSTIRLKHPEAF